MDRFAIALAGIAPLLLSAACGGDPAQGIATDGEGQTDSTSTTTSSMSSSAATTVSTATTESASGGATTNGASMSASGGDGATSGTSAASGGSTTANGETTGSASNGGTTSGSTGSADIPVGQPCEILDTCEGAAECCLAPQCNEHCFVPCGDNLPACEDGFSCAHGFCLLECEEDEDCEEDLTPDFTCQNDGSLCQSN